MGPGPGVERARQFLRFAYPLQSRGLDWSDISCVAVCHERWSRGSVGGSG